MNILITGVAGFIGSCLADRLLADGHTVCGVDNLSTGRRENVASTVDFFEQDIRNIRSVLPLIDDPHLVIHCAASYKDPQKWHTDADVNVLGTIDMTLVAKAFECPIVYMQTALPPVSSYAISKTAGMQYILQAGVPALVFRLANIYGPRNLSGPIPTFYKRLAEGLPCTVVDTTRDMVYIDDLVRCVVGAIGEGRTGIYDVCSGVQTPIEDLFDAVDKAVSSSAFAELFPPGPDEAQTHVSLENRVPGWETTTDLATGISRACDWYRDNHPEHTFTHLRQVSGV